MSWFEGVLSAHRPVCRHRPGPTAEFAAGETAARRRLADLARRGRQVAGCVAEPPEAVPCRSTGNAAAAYWQLQRSQWAFAPSA